MVMDLVGFASELFNYRKHCNTIHRCIVGNHWSNTAMLLRIVAITSLLETITYGKV